MTAWKALRPLNLSAKAGVGWCLWYVSQVGGVDTSRSSRAIYEWQKAKYRHGPNEPLPDVPVLLFFSHYGHYNEGPGEYGHVAWNVPGRGIFTSPWQSEYAPPSYEVWQRIRQIEIRFDCKYLGWAEDLGGKRFAEPAPEPEPIPIPKEGKRMFLAFFKHALGEGRPAWAFFGPGFYLPLNTKKTVVKFKAQIRMDEDSFDCGDSAANWRRFQDSTGLPREQIELMDEAAR